MESNGCVLVDIFFCFSDIIHHSRVKNTPLKYIKKLPLEATQKMKGLDSLGNQPVSRSWRRPKTSCGSPGHMCLQASTLNPATLMSVCSCSRPPYPDNLFPRREPTDQPDFLLLCIILFIFIDSFMLIVHNMYMAMTDLATKITGLCLSNSGLFCGRSG